jgi:hypothetical protein
VSEFYIDDRRGWRMGLKNVVGGIKGEIMDERTNGHK